MAEQKIDWGKPLSHSSRNPRRNKPSSKRDQRQRHRNSFSGTYSTYNRCECCNIPVGKDENFSDIRDSWRKAGERGRYGDLGLVLCEECSMKLSDMTDAEAFTALTGRDFATVNHRKMLSDLAENVQKWSRAKIKAEIEKVEADPAPFSSDEDIYECNYLVILRRELRIREMAFGESEDNAVENSL